jgi:hypothetical protein
MFPENSDRSKILRDAMPDGSSVGTSGGKRITSAFICVHLRLSAVKKIF